MTIDQQRIRLKTLKVADFASEETLCFTATVLFDGKPVATASNDGHGGSTHLLALQGQRDRFAEAQAFAAALPPDVTEYDDPKDSAGRLIIDITLDYLVDDLAANEHADKKLRAAFKRHMNSKLLFVKNGKLVFLKDVNPKTILDRPAYFAALRARQAQPVVILAELPPTEAFDVWRRHVLADDPS
ncbi:MAG: hypothetical protein A2710_07240 [Burkholderiales bacterium RIFCSPHIGHO2_01_FULL_64_960]|nr:MAG: hypothetical protein A2710_07240 [Burkholderiales bacterium RIFCSPHIGHO2_01_FULL_64_960]